MTGWVVLLLKHIGLKCQNFRTKVFDALRKDSPEVLNKLVAIGGDMSLAELGISSADTKILAENVSIVFHSAATVKFDEVLKSAVEMNLKGTMRLVQLCRKMERLEVNSFLIFQLKLFLMIKKRICLVNNLVSCERYTHILITL